MGKKGFTLVELLAVIAILAILVIVAMPNVLGMFNNAKVDIFITDVQKYLDTAKAQFTSDAFRNAGKTVYYSSNDNASLGTSKLNIEGKKEYFIEMDRHGVFKRIVIYDENYCYDIYSVGTSGDLSGINSIRKTDEINKSSVIKDDIWLSGNDSVVADTSNSNYKVYGCQALLSVTGKLGGLNPDDGSEPELNEVYKNADYKYTYKKLVFNGVSYYGWVVELNEEVTDRSKTSYANILQSINGKPIISLQNTFKNCVNLVTPPDIPDTVLVLSSTFYGCTSLISPPDIPASVLSLTSTFYGCTSLVNAPSLPSGLLFMQGTFYGCTSLVSASNIPSSVKAMIGVFYGCSSLTGTINIDAEPVQIGNVFSNVDFKTQNITLTGSSSKLDNIGKTGLNYCDVCNGVCLIHKGECDGSCTDAHLIRFTIQGVEYFAEKNMTWGDWINSSYSRGIDCFAHPQLGGAIMCNGSRVRSPEGGQFGDARVIIDGEVYN